jgi:hypothetical protein
LGLSGDGGGRGRTERKAEEGVLSPLTCGAMVGVSVGEPGSECGICCEAQVLIWISLLAFLSAAAPPPQTR